jgi:ATP-binding cassette subfamily B (MDR/TAP) protein 1
VQVLENTMTKQQNSEQAKDLMVPYSKLTSLASGSDNCLKWTGWISASIAGLGMPSFVFLFGDIIDSLNPALSPQKQFEQMIPLTLIMIGIGAGIWIFSFAFYGALIHFSESISNKIKIAYLKAVLGQEAAWYDLTNPMELSSKIGKETLAIQKALGEKLGTIIMALSMSVSGFAFAATRGITLTAALFAYFPIIVFCMHMMT